MKNPLLSQVLVAQASQPAGPTNLLNVRKFFKVCGLGNPRYSRLGNRRYARLAMLCAMLAAAGGSSTRADTVLASKHDLSASGPGTIKATAESDSCAFCHTPHRGTGEIPLWNHAMSTASYIPYSSSTIKATIG